MAVLRAARTLSFSHRIAAGAWGVGMGPGRRWVLTGSCCCPVGALLVVREAVSADPREHAADAAARLLGVPAHAVRSLVSGVDGRSDDGTEWYGYGQRVAEVLGIAREVRG